MADKGIIFSAPMVRALLDGRKTQTRRLLKPHPVQHVPDLAFTWGKYTGLWPDDWFGHGNAIDDALPYAPGDRLYVREAWRMPDAFDAHTPKAAKAMVTRGGYGPNVFFEVDGTVRSAGAYTGSPGRLRSARFMPRWASRLWLEVTDVRVQRVQEISEEDAIAEGIQSFRPDHSVATFFHHTVPEYRNYGFMNARRAFEDLWNSLHTKPGETWEANPWVVAVSFTVHRGNIDKGE